MGETNAKLTPETVLSIDICRLQKSVKLSTFECRKHKKIGEEGNLDEPAEPVDVYRLLAVRSFVQADFPTGPVRYV